jgi:Stress responsive A/B Barrel Domain
VIRHIVIWRLSEKAKKDIDTVLKPVHALVGPLLSNVAGLKRLELQSNKSESPDAVDLLLYSEFDSWESLHAYEAHPLHLELRRLIGPIRSERRVFDSEM